MASPIDRRAGGILRALTAAFVLAAVAWTVTSAVALSTTFDEPHHLTTGLAWWQFGDARWWTENPPLPKIAIAALPYLAGLRLRSAPAAAPERDPWDVGLELLDGRSDAARMLLLARLGTVAFLLLALGATWVLAGGRRRPLAAGIATVLVATYPALLGHAGLATTDVAAVATLLLFLVAVDRWAAGPTPGCAAAVGAAFACALLCKLTAPLFCAAGALGWLVARRLVGGVWLGRGAVEGERRTARRRSLPIQIALGALVAFLVTWVGYRFSVGRLEAFAPADYLGTAVVPPAAVRSGFMSWLCHLPLPMPEVLHGALFLRAHDQHGHTAFLFGRLSAHGFWNFYLVGLLLKSPLPFLGLVVMAAVVLSRRAVQAAGAVDAPALGAGLAALGTLALSTIMTVNIGMRHLLCVAPLLAIFVGRTLAPWLESLVGRRRRVLGFGGLAVAMAANAWIVQRAHPELFAYFNPLAGREPGHALIDSDLDWGQDMGLLKRELHARQISAIHYGLFAIVNPCDPGMPTMQVLEPGKPVDGWIVLSEQFYRSTLHFSFRRASCAPEAKYEFHEDPGDAFDWLKQVPLTARIGASLRLYHLPER